MSGLATATECPCGCGVVSLKGLSTRSGHVPNCGKTEYGATAVCRSCTGRRNRKKGQAGEARRHRRLGGEGFTPRDDLMHLYSVNVATEDKTGAQIPRHFVTFVHSETARHWFYQADKKIPVGSDAKAALYLEVSPSEWYLVVRGEGDRRK